MNNDKIVISIIIMAVSTYLIRMLPLTIFRKKIKSQFIRSFLHYVPFAVLGAMTFPAVFFSTGYIISAVCGVIAALILTLKGRSMITVALVASLTVYIVEKIIFFIN